MTPDEIMEVFSCGESFSSNAEVKAVLVIYKENVMSDA